MTDPNRAELIRIYNAYPHLRAWLLVSTRWAAWLSRIPLPLWLHNRILRAGMVILMWVTPKG